MCVMAEGWQGSALSGGAHSFSAAFHSSLFICLASPRVFFFFFGPAASSAAAAASFPAEVNPKAWPPVQETTR